MGSRTVPRLAMYQPEIAANLGAAIRIAACFGVALDVIEPCGFPWRKRDIDRVALDYQTPLLRHADWESFARRLPGRLLLLTTKGAQSYWTTTFEPTDTLLLGQESAGVPEAIHEAADQRLTIPMAQGARSLNVAVSGAVVFGEAARQAAFDL
ncbi:MAG: TrmH family RNA methyltransferase [Pseudomonadota bacterium]